ERRYLSANLQLEKSLQEIGTAVFYLTASPRPDHRPRDSVKYPHIRKLIFDLGNVAGDHGAALTFYLDDDKKRGSLQAILDILHDLSPVIFSKAAFNTVKAMRLWGEQRLEDEAQLYLSHLDEDDPLFHENDRSA